MLTFCLPNLRAHGFPLPGGSYTVKKIAHKSPFTEHTKLRKAIYKSLSKAPNWLSNRNPLNGSQAPIRMGKIYVSKTKKKQAYTNTGTHICTHTHTHTSLFLPSLWARRRVSAGHLWLRVPVGGTYFKETKAMKEKRQNPFSAYHDFLKGLHTVFPMFGCQGPSKVTSPTTAIHEKWHLLSDALTAPTSRESRLPLLAHQQQFLPYGLLI